MRRKGKIEKQKTPKFSVVIPAYNEEKNISRCLDHILRQKGTVSYEVIVINNNSTDQTKKIALSKKCRVIDESKQRVTVARNRGIKAARGKIVVFVDADCLVPPDYLRKIKIFFELHPDISGLSGPYVYSDGGRLVRWVTNNLNYLYYLFKLVKLSFGFEVMNGGNMAVRKTALQSVGGFNEKITNIICPDDLEIAVRLQRAGFNLYLDKNLKVLSSYRRIKRGGIRHGWNKSWCALRILFGAR